MIAPGTAFWGTAIPLDGPNDDASQIFPPGFLQNVNPFVVMYAALPSQGTKILPGLIHINEGHLKSLVNKKKPKGKPGYRLTHLGDDNPPVEIILGMWRAAQWKEWLRMLPLIHPLDGGPPPAVGVQNPILNGYGIESLYLLQVSLLKLSPRPPKGSPEWGEVSMRFHQFLPPKAKNVKKTPVSATDTSAVPKDAVAVPAKTNAGSDPAKVEGNSPSTKPPFQMNFGPNLDAHIGG